MRQPKPRYPVTTAELIFAAEARKPKDPETLALNKRCDQHQAHQESVFKEAFGQTPREKALEE